MLSKPVTTALLLLSCCYAAPSSAQPIYQWAYGLPGFSTWTQQRANQPSSLMVNRHGDAYLFGSFAEAMDVDPGPNVDTLKATPAQGSASYLCKYNAAGQLLWARNIGTGGWTSTLGYDGHWYAGGYGGVDSMGMGYSTDTLSTPGLFLAKYDSTDHLVWAKAPRVDAKILDMKADHDGNLYITGVFNGTVDMDPAHPGTVVFTSSLLDGYLAKYDGDGTFLWARQIKGNDGDQGLVLAVDMNNNVFMTGYTAGFMTPSSTFMDTGNVFRTLVCHGGYDGYVAKYTSDGAIAWLQALGGAGHDYGRGVAVDKAGNVYATGYYTTSMTVDTAANIVLNAGGNNQSGYLVKLNGATGHPVWAKNYGCDTGVNAVSFAQAVVCDDSSNVYMTGMFQKTVVLDPAHPTAAGTTHANSEDYYVLKLDSAGHYKWHIHTYSGWDDEAYQLVLGPDNDVYVSGYISDTTDFDLNGPGGLVAYPMLNPNWVTVSFIARYKQPKPAGLGNVERGMYALYPNPASDQLILRGMLSDKARISIHDVPGRECKTTTYLRSTGAVTDIRALTPGVYILEYSENGIDLYRGKFVKE
ncbi:MAG: SBBP repeat-containing protein [Bacteroidetes bacterium]|nr:SBBP repeat-containing protein [Bacteroidota bacterium]